MDDLLGIVTDLVTRNAKPGTGDLKADADTALADRGLNSLAVIALITDLERTLTIRFPAELISRETFTSARSVAAAVHRLRAGQENPA